MSPVTSLTPADCVPAFSVAHWEQLQQEKEDLERRFEAELQGLQAQQQRELGALEQRLKARHMDETERLRVQQRDELEELRFRQEEQVGAVRVQMTIQYSDKRNTSSLLVNSSILPYSMELNYKVDFVFVN